MRSFRFMIWVLAMSVAMGVLGYTGCASFSQRAKLQSFDEVSKHYRLAMLRSNYDQAVEIGQSDAPKDLSFLNNFHVVSYTLKKITFSKEKSEAFQTVEIEYYRVDSMRQKIVIDEQKWSYQPDNQMWVLSSGLPRFH